MHACGLQAHAASLGDRLWKYLSIEDSILRLSLRTICLVSALPDAMLVCLFVPVAVPFPIVGSTFIVRPFQVAFVRGYHLPWTAYIGLSLISGHEKPEM